MNTNSTDTSAKRGPALSYWEGEGAADIVERRPRWEPTTLRQIRDVLAAAWETVDEIEEYSDHDKAWVCAGIALALWREDRISRPLADEALRAANWEAGALDAEV